MAPGPGYIRSILTRLLAAGGYLGTGTAAGGDLNGSTYPNPEVAAGKITLAKLANLATDKLIGRDTAGTGVPEAIGLGTGLEFTGSATIQRSALTGDVTASAGSNATTIAAAAVTLAKMADIATDRLIGRDTAGTGVPEALTVGGGVEFSGSGGIQRSALTGDATASAGSGTVTVVKVNGVTVAGAPSAGQVPVASGAADATWATLATASAMDASATGTASTTDASATTCGTYTPADGAVVCVEISVAATSSGGSVGAGFRFAATFRRAGGTTTLIGAVVSLSLNADAGAATWTASADASGTDIRIRVTGQIATNINWRSRVHVTAALT